MRVEHISLENFRNYTSAETDFAPCTNVITGANAQGKTNLLEAVFMLSGGKSFRTRFDRELIYFDSAVSEISADINAGGRDQNIKIIMAQGRRKQITRNGVKETASNLSNTVNAVLFCPDDLNMIKEGAAYRRKFIDTAASQLRPGYASLLSEYGRLYEQKSSILRLWREKPSLLELLDNFSESMCLVCAKIIRYRAAFVRAVNNYASSIHSEFSGGSEDLELIYRTVKTVSDPLASEKEIFRQVHRHWEEHRRAELDAGKCLSGAHKDDVEILINDKPARVYASQGQSRTAALSMKLAEREIFMSESGEYPILLLDDVLSELDSRRQEFVLNRISGGQTLITCCEDGDLSARTGGKIICVAGGKIS